MPTLLATFRKVKPSNPKSGNGDTFRTMFHRIALCISIPLLIAACVSDKAGEPMFEESGDEQSVLGSGPESPAADDAGEDAGEEAALGRRAACMERCACAGRVHPENNRV